MKTNIPKIRVLLVDEMRIVREGWKDILSTAEDIYIIGESTPSSLLQTMPTAKVVDIIVANISILIGTDKKRNILRLIKDKYPNIKILLIVENEKDMRSARRAGADEALGKPYLSNAFIDLIRGLKRDAKSICDYYAGELDKLGVNLRYSDKYEKLIRNIIDLVFSSQLSFSQYYLIEEQDYRMAVIVYRNRRLQPFWEKLYSKHYCEYINVLLQNTDRTNQELIKQLTDGLTSKTGNLGVVIIRMEKNLSTEDVQFSLYENEQKILIVLTDKEIRHMLAQMAAGRDPVQLFEEEYDKFIGTMTRKLRRYHHS